MSIFRSSISVFVLCAAGIAGAGAQTTVSSSPANPASSPSRHDDDVVNLETLVVSSGPDARSAFDLAQGTSILAGDTLRRQTQSTLGETLAQTPGVSSTYYGPGASRPIIRGLGGDRVRVLSDGVGTLDASNVSPDHNVAIEPLFASRIEVLRGPSTLLYGSSAVGGAVNVIDNRIPSEPGDGEAHGALELRGFGAADERTGVLSVGGGSQSFVGQLDALRTKTDDTHIPGVARINAHAPAEQPDGILPNSAIDTKDLSLGGTAFWNAGHLGASVHRYETRYGVPVAEDEPVTIDMKQTRYDLDGEITQPFGIFRGAKAHAGYGRYHHDELDGDVVGTSFRNNTWESRVELPHVPLGEITGTIGAQSWRSDFSAIGDEVVTPPSRTFGGALFALEEWKASSAATLQFGARVERQSIRLGDVSDELPALAGYAARSGEKKNFTGASASLGAVFYPAKDYSLGVSLAYTERLPTVQELFSNGPHGGTDAYEVGTTGLNNEKSLGLDVSLRKRAGFVTGSLGGFVNRFSDFIFEQQLPAGSIPAANNPEGLTEYQFIARDALFYGGEAEVTLHFVDTDNYGLHVVLTSDYVHAEQTTDETPLPRIPPWRLGAALRFNHAHWRAGVGVQRAQAQNRFTAEETRTPGYTLLNADVSYELPAGKLTYEIFARGNNLTNEEARVSTSFLINLAPLAGRDVTMGARVRF